MDIPKAPSEANIKSATSGTPQSLTLDSLSDIQHLKLKQNTPYSARVVNSLDAFLGSQPASQTAAEELTNPASKTLAPQNQSTSPKNWIILLQGKLLHITSETPLKPEQMLQLMLTKQGLTALRPPTTELSPGLTSSLSPTEIKTTLNAMNQLMSRQTTIESALLQLLQTINKPGTSTASQDVSKALVSLLSNLPGKNSLKEALSVATPPTNTTGNPPKTMPSSPLQQTTDLQRTPSQLLNQAQSANSSAEKPYPAISPNAVKRLMENSGLGFEHTLSKDTHTRARFIQQLAQISSTKASQIKPANLTSGEPSKPTLASTPPITINIRNNISNALRSLINAPSADAQTIQNITNTGQSTQSSNSPDSKPSKTHVKESALFDLIKSFSQNNSGEISDKQAPPSTNLKELLILLSASLIGNSDEQSKEFLKALQSPALLQAPFNFPPLLTQSLMKAEALLADQELSTGQLLKLFASMINRIQFNQLNSLYQSQMASSESNNVQSWFFELPVLVEGKQLELFNLRIDKEEEKEAQDSHQEDNKQQVQWRIALSFDFESLGAIYIQAHITPPSISSIIWANNSKTLSLINREQTFFRERLSQLGLEVGDIHCRYGQPKANKAKLDRSLIDINA